MKSYFSKMHTWLRFLMLMFVCVLGGANSSAYAQDPIHFPATSWIQTISGVTVQAAYPTGSSFDVYGGGTDQYGYVRITSSEGNIVRVVFNANSDANLLMANDGEFTSKTSTSATWEGSSDNILFSAENDVYVTSIDVYVSAGSSTPVAALDGTPQLVSLPYDNTFDTDADIENLLAIDNNADGNTFKAADGVVSIKQHAVNQNDDYLVICKANLIANKKYNLSFDAKSTVDNAWHYYAVYVGTEPTASSLTTLINSTSWASVWTTDWESQTATEFTVAVDGTYYFAIFNHPYSGSASMLIDNFHLEAAPADMPAAVDEVTVEPNDAGALRATISFTMPSANYGGDEYSDGKRLTYHIYRCQSGWGELGVGDVEIFSGNANAGTDVEYVDESASNGTNYYAVVITDGALTSRIARGSAYVGADIPESPSNVQMSVNGNRVTLTWNAPTRGQNGGFIGTPTYNVYTYVNYSEGSVINDSPITETTYSFDFDMNSGEQRDIKFSVKAVTTGGSSYSAQTPNSISVGAPYALPYNEDFSTNNNRYKFEATTGTGYGSRWGDESYMTGYSNGSAVQFQTGKIAFAGSNALLTFDYKTDAPAISFDIVVRDNDGTETVVETISNPTDNYQSANVLLGGAYKNAAWVNVIIRANYPTAYTYAYLDNISIIAKAPTYAVTVNPSIANGTVTADKTEAEAGETVTLTATPAVGYQFGSWAVTTTAGGTPVAVANNQFTMPAEAVTVSATFDQKPPINDNYSNALTSQVLFDDFTVIDANEDAVKWIFYEGQARIQWNSAQAMNDYLVTPGITISGGNYRLSVDMREYGAGYPEKFEIVYGTAPTADALTTQIIGVTTPTASYVTYSQEFEISTPGVYYFAIHGVSDRDKWYLYAKNFAIEKIVPPATYAVTLDDVANGSISASVGATPVSTGDEFVEGTTITLAANPDGGYEFDSWNVTDEEGNSVTVTNNEFSMPASAVTISATFSRIEFTTFDFATNADINVQGVSASYDRSSGAYIYTNMGIAHKLVLTSTKAITKVVFPSITNYGGTLVASTGDYDAGTKTWTGSATSLEFSTESGSIIIPSANVWVDGGFDVVTASEFAAPTSAMAAESQESIDNDVLTFDAPVTIYNQQATGSTYKATIGGQVAKLTANGSTVNVSINSPIISRSTPELVIPAGMLRIGNNFNSNEIRVSYDVTGEPFREPTSAWKGETVGAPDGYPYHELTSDELTFRANVDVLFNSRITFDGAPVSVLASGRVLRVNFGSVTTPGTHTLHFAASAIAVNDVATPEFDVIYTIQKTVGVVAAPSSQNAGSVRELSEDVLTFAGNVAWDSSIKILFGKTGQEEEVTPAIDGATLTFSGLDEIATESGNYHLVIPAQAIGVDGTYNNAAIEINYTLSLPQYKPAVHFDLASGIPGPKNFVSVSGNSNLYNGLADLQWGNLVVSSLGNNTIAKVIFYGSNGMDQILATMGTFTSASATTATWVDNDTPVTSVRFTSDGDIYVGAIDVILYDENPEDELMNGSVNVQSLPYTCAFADASTGKAYDVNGDGTGFVYDAAGFAKIKATGSANDYLVVAGFNLTAGVHYTASADVKAIGGTQTANLALGTSATDMSTFTQNLLYLTTASTEWENKSVAEFTVSATGTYYLAVKCTYGAGEFDVDNVHIAEAGTKMPMAVDDLEVTPDAMGALSATIAFTMPTTNYDGEPYGDGDRLTYSIYRNELVFFSGQAAPGDKVNVTDETAPAGNNTYSVIISDGSNGDSRAANANAYIGQDVPRAPQNVHITNIDGNNITVAWDDVTEDIHGQSIAPKYNVYVDGVKHNAELIEETECTFEYDLNAGAQRDVRFSVSAENATGESSATSTSESLLAGAADALPYSLPFAESGNPYYDKDAGTGHCDIVDNTLMMSSFRVSSATVEVTTGKISFNDDATLTFYYKSNQSGNVLKVSVITSDGGEDDIILNEKLSETDGFVSQSLDLSDYKSCSWIRIKITSVFDVENQYFYIKNLTVKYEPKYTEQTLNLVGHNSDGYWATFSNANDVFFTTQTSVYTISLDGETLVRSNEFEYGSIVVDDETIYGYFVPAETGVLVNTGEEASVPYYTITHGEVADFAGTNYLRAASVAMEATGYKFYKFAYGDNINKTKLGFWWGAEGGAPFTAKVGGAYLAIPVSQASAIRGFSFDEQGFGTHINAVESLDENTGVYTLDGRKVSNDQKLRKGTYIVNGKKIVNF